MSSQSLKINTPETLVAVLKDAGGNRGAAIVGKPSWTADDLGKLSDFTPSADGLSCAIQTGPTVGTVTITASALAPDGSSLTDTFTISITPGDAASLSIEPQA